MTRQNKKMKVRNENRPGYKKTRVGWIPEEWEIHKLSACSELRISNVNKKCKPDELKILLCNYKDVYHNEEITNDLPFMLATAKKSEIESFSIKKGDVLITKDSESPQDIGIPAFVKNHMDRLLCGYHLILIRPYDVTLNGRFLSKFLQSHRMKYYFSTVANGVTRFGLTLNSVKELKLPIPQLIEQNKIVATLSTWDKAITQTQTLIDSKTKLKKGLTQKLLTGQLRVTISPSSKTFIQTKIGLLPEDWEVKPFTALFQRISEPIRVKQEKEYREIGIRSHGKGVFHKNPVTGAQLGNKRVFHVKPGTLVFNIVFAWEQAVGIFSEKENGFIASHRFPMFRADQAKCLEAFALLFFLSKRGKHGLGIASPGGAGRNKTLGQQELNHLYLPIPPIHEQKKIIHILNLCETEITQLTKQKNALEKQKKGLMQKLLTGEIRV